MVPIIARSTESVVGTIVLSMSVASSDVVNWMASQWGR